MTAGLLLKDLLGLKGFTKMMGVLMLLYLGIGVYTKDLSTASAALVVMCAMLPMTNIALDDQNKWNAYACCLPMRRSQIILGKYLLVLVLVALSLVILGVVGLAMTPFFTVDWWGMLATAGAVTCATLVMNGLTMPLMIKFGVEKARLVIMILFMAIFFLFMQFDAARQLLAGMGSLSLWLIALLVAAVYVGSYFVSVRIYEKKEF